MPTGYSPCSHLALLERHNVFWFSCLLLRVDGLGLFLVCIGLDLDSAHVVLVFVETTKMFFECCSFMGRWSYPSKQGPLSHLLFRKLVGIQ